MKRISPVGVGLKVGGPGSHQPLRCQGNPVMEVMIRQKAAKARRGVKRCGISGGEAPGGHGVLDSPHTHMRLELITRLISHTG